MPKGIFEDLKGKQYGSLTVLRRAENFESDKGTDSRTQWVVECKCGFQEKVPTRYLKRGDKKACAKCIPKKGGEGHNGRAKYWGNNSEVVG